MSLVAVAESTGSCTVHEVGGTEPIVDVDDCHGVYQSSKYNCNCHTLSFDCFENLPGSSMFVRSQERHLICYGYAFMLRMANLLGFFMQASQVGSKVLLTGLLPTISNRGYSSFNTFWKYEGHNVRAISSI